MNKDLLFFTAATGRYKQFVTPYIFFALYHNRNAKAEVLIDSLDKYVRENAAAMKTLNRLFPNDFLLREIPRGIEPHTARFVVTPVMDMQYTYANDVDILILESNVVETHTMLMNSHNSIFSNRMRGTKKLTGLHFVQTHPYYEVTAKARQENKLQDEEALYSIVKTSIGDPLKLASDVRPVHGFHLSMNRPPVAPTGQAAWKMGPEPLRAIYRATIQSREYREIYPTFNERFKLMLKELNKHVL